jgi:hypothetical protein
MAKIEKRTAVKLRTPHIGALPFTKTNYMILAVGILSIVLGYIALGQDPWDGTMPLVFAPILLVIGYCILIPLGILYRKNTSNNSAAVPVNMRSENSH